MTDNAHKIAAIDGAMRHIKTEIARAAGLTIHKIPEFEAIKEALEFHRRALGIFVLDVDLKDQFDGKFDEAKVWKKRDGWGIKPARTVSAKGERMRLEPGAYVHEDEYNRLLTINEELLVALKYAQTMIHNAPIIDGAVARAEAAKGK